MKLSFVIPTHNCATWLPHAVSSCLKQTYKDIEVVVMDDGSTDRTQEYLTWLAKSEPRAKVLKTEVNVGRSSARNMGNQKAQGDIICVLDADDLATPNRAEITVNKFKSGKIDYLYGAATVIDCVGVPMYEIRPDVFNKDKALNPPFENKIVHSTAAYTRDFAHKYPYLGGDMAKLGIDDWSQQIRARIDGARFDFVPQRLCAYRILQSSISKTRDKEAVAKAKKEYLASLLAVA